MNRVHTKLYLIVLLCWSPAPAFAGVQTREATIRLFLVGSSVPQTNLKRVLWQGPITARDLRHKNYIALRRLRNAIFAVKQARFRSADLRAFYKKQRWYRPFRSPGRITLTTWAKRNLRFILQAEKAAKAKDIAAYRKKVWGARPKVTIKGAIFCFDVGAYRVVQDFRAIRVGTKTGGPCQISRGTVYTYKRTYKSDFWFHGIFKHTAFLRRVTGSGWQELLIVNLKARKIVYKNEHMPPNSNVRLDKKNERLHFNQDLRLPKGCTVKRVKKCWAAVVARYPALKGQSAPTCKCHRIMSPFITVPYVWDLRKPNAPPKLLPKVNCRCSM